VTDGFANIVQLLLESKADAVALDSEGLSPMQYAVQEEHFHVQAVLRDWGLEKGDTLSLRLEGPNGQHTLNIPINATFEEMTRLVTRLTGTRNPEIILKSGLSTMSLDGRHAQSRILHDLGVSHRDVLLVNESNDDPDSHPTSHPSSHPRSHPGQKEVDRLRSGDTPTLTSLSPRVVASCDCPSSKNEFDRLPVEILPEHIFYEFSTHVLAKCALVAKGWNKALNSELLWASRYKAEWSFEEEKNAIRGLYGSILVEKLNSMWGGGGRLSGSSKTWRKMLRLERCYGKGLRQTSQTAGHPRGVWCMEVLRRGAFLTGSEDASLCLWDSRSQEAVQVLEGHTGTVKCLKTLGKWALSGSLDSTARLWELPPPPLRSKNTYGTGSTPSPVAKCAAVLSGHGRGVRDVAFGTTVELLVTAAEDGIVRLWDGRRGKLRESLKGHTGKLHTCEVQGNSRVVSGGADGTVRVWDINTGKSVSVLDREEDGWVGHFSLDGRDKILSGHKSGVVILWDTRAKREAAILDGHTDHVQHTAVHGPPASTYVTCGRDNTLRIWDSRKMESMAICRGHQGIVVNFYSDAAKIVSASWDGTLRVWKHATGELLDTISVHGGQIRAVAFDDDGMLMSADSDGEVYQHNYGLL